MDKQTGPNDFLVVLPSEIIEIPQDSDKSWLTAPYSEERRRFAKERAINQLLNGSNCPHKSY